MIEWKSDRDESCWKYIVWYFMPTVITQAQFTYRASDKNSHLLPIFELFSFRFLLCCCITLALSCIWLRTSKSFTERIPSLKNVIFLLLYIANRLVSFIFKKNKLFLRLLKITDGFLTRGERGSCFFFLPFILYLEMAWHTRGLLHLIWRKQRDTLDQNVRLGIFQKGNILFLKYLSVTSRELFCELLVHGFHFEGKVCGKHAELLLADSAAEFSDSSTDVWWQKVWIQVWTTPFHSIIGIWESSQCKRLAYNPL